MRAGARGAAPVSCCSDDGWRERSGRAIAGTVPAHDRRAPASHADVAVVGAGAAGLYAALTAAREGARVALVSATPLAQTASYWAQGGIAAALAADDSPDLHRHDTELAGRGARAPVRRRASCAARRRASSRDLERLGVRFDVDADGGLALGLEGGHSQAPRRPRRRQRDRPPRRAPAVRARRREPGASTSSSRRAPRRSGRRDGRCVGVVCEDGRAIAARGVVLATGGAAALWSRTTNPPGSRRDRRAARARGGRRARRPRVRCSSTRPRSPASRAARASSSPRRSAARARRSSTTTASASSRSSRRATRSRARSTRRCARPARRTCGSTCATSTRRRSRTSSRRCRRPASTRRTELVPVSPAAHYVMGGVVTDLDGATTRAGPVRRRRDRVHRAARREPARLELAERVLRLRRSARRSRRSTSRALPGGADAPRARADPAALARDPRGACGATPGSSATRDGLRTLLDDPHPLARLVARVRAAARGDRAAATSARTSRRPTPGWMATTR